MVTSYWFIGQLIVEDAEYGKAVLEGLSKKLTAEFGKGFDECNLQRVFFSIYATNPDCFLLSASPFNKRTIDFYYV